METTKQLLITPEVQRYKDCLGTISPIKVATMLETPLHKIQEEIAGYFEAPYVHTWDYMVLKLARRLGKTYVARKIIVTLLLTPESKIALVSHSTTLSDETFNEVLKDLMRIPELRDKIKSYKKEGIIEIPELNTKLITASYLNYESRMVGRANTHLILDEFFLIPPDIQQNILNFLEPTLITYGRTEEGIANGKVLIMSTPRGTQLGSIAGLKDLAGIQGKKGHKSFKYTIYDSPFLTDKEIEDIRQSTPPDIFAQEYMVEYTKTDKTTFRHFNKDKHIIKMPMEMLKDMINCCDFIVATDYGMADGSSALFLLYNNKNETYYAFDEIYVKETVTYDFIKMFKKKTEYWCKALEYNFDNVLFFYDASARESAIIAQQQFNITMIKARNKLFEGTDRVNQLFQGKGDSKISNLYIADTCEKTIYMVEFCENKVVNGIITPQFARDKGILQSHFDLAICLVYGTYTHFKTLHNTIVIS